MFVSCCFHCCIPMLNTHGTAWNKQDVCQAGGLRAKQFPSTSPCREQCSDLIRFEIPGKWYKAANE